MQVIVRAGAAWGRIGRWALTAAVMAGACTPLAPDDDTWLSVPASDAEETTLVVAPAVCEDDPPPAPLADAHPDLEIELEDVGPALLEPGDAPRLRATLVNRSEDATHRVIMPGHGSAGFRREPALAFVESTETSPGCWQTEVAQANYSCGTYSPVDWTKDAIALAPGERLELAVELAATPRWRTRWQTGRTSVRLRYAYTAGATVTRGEFPIPKTLRDTAPFQVVSNEVELVYVAPLRLTMAPRHPARGSTSVLLDEAVSLDLENLSSSRRDVLLPSERTLRFEVRGGGQIKASWQPGLVPTPVAVGPGERVALIGPSGVNAGLEYALLDVDRDAPLVIRAVYHPFEDRGAWLPSEWVVLDLR